MNKEYIINIMIKELGEPDSLDFLNEYLDFLLDYKNDSIGYRENHHILPRALFKDFENVDWNQKYILYEDHIFAHELLFQAFTNRTFSRPLNFMKSQLSKDHDMLSKASKKGWESLKNDQKKYKDWICKRSKYMKSLSKDERSARSKKMWDSLNSEAYNNRCRINKDNWTEERKMLKSKQMREYFKNNPDEMSKRSKKMWNNMDSNKKDKFNIKMNDVNKDPIKRQKAGDSIKKKWKNSEFRDKMRSRKTSKRQVIAINPSGEIFEFNGLTSMIELYNFNRTLIDKFRNTGKPVESKNVKNKESIANTIGWKFNYIKYGETK